MQQPPQYGIGRTVSSWCVESDSRTVCVSFVLSGTLHVDSMGFSVVRTSDVVITRHIVMMRSLLTSSLTPLLMIPTTVAVVKERAAVVV